MASAAYGSSSASAMNRADGMTRRAAGYPAGRQALEAAEGGGLGGGGGNGGLPSPDDGKKGAGGRGGRSELPGAMWGALGVLHLLTLAVLSAYSASGLGGYVVGIGVVCFGAVAYSHHLAAEILSRDCGSADMQAVAASIRTGAHAFMRVQYTRIAQVALVVAAALFVFYTYRDPGPLQLPRTVLAGVTAGSFLIGAVCSAGAGYVGMWVSVRVNGRVAAAAAAGDGPLALQICFRGGAISAVLSAAGCILGIVTLFVLADALVVPGSSLQPGDVPFLFVGYGFGASLVALFMQLGGGIYTKAADVGADMVGKIDAGIPEDDPRNPAVIADLVGDNVGDCAGSMADVFESIAAEVIGAMILGGTLAKEAGLKNGGASFIFFPLIMHTADVVISTCGVLAARARSPGDDPLDCMLRSYGGCMALATLVMLCATRLLLDVEGLPGVWLHYFGCGLIGIVTALCYMLVTRYYTDYNYPPVRSIAKASETGHGTNVIQGVAVGLESTGVPALIIAASLLGSYSLGASCGLPARNAGLFGTAVATMGMLCTAVYVLAMNNFGPIADNAGGIVEMSGQPSAVREITDQLDAVGNVTKAATKGYSIGTAALASFLLFSAFVDEFSLYAGVPFETVNLTQPEVLVGGLLGVALIFVFAAWAMAAVSRTAQAVVAEVRRQFAEIPGILEFHTPPDYGACVAIVTRAALGEMAKPAFLVVAAPLCIGLGFKALGSATGRPLLAAEVLGSFLMLATLTGLLLALFLDNAGGAWDNAKKLIESGAHGGKGSDAHKAAVTGDTVGDPFKDTAGPSLHVVIKLLSTVILVLGPLFVASAGTTPADGALGEAVGDAFGGAELAMEDFIDDPNSILG